MADEEKEIKEWPVDNFPGWTRIQVGGARRYRSPDGIEISNARFYSLSQKYKATGIIPVTEVVEQERKQKIYKSAVESSPSYSEPDYSEDGVLNLPEAKPKPGRATGKRASAREIATSTETTLLILTSVFALALGASDLQMSESEAKAISIPFANIFESSKLNEQFGRLFASSGDYQLLGYALYLYGYRVFTTMARKVNESTRSSAQNKTAASNGATGGVGATPRGTTPVGAALPYRR